MLQKRQIVKILGKACQSDCHVGRPISLLLCSENAAPFKEISKLRKSLTKPGSIRPVQKLNLKYLDPEAKASSTNGR